MREISLCMSLVGLCLASFSAQAASDDPNKHVYQFYHLYLDNPAIHDEVLTEYVAKPLLEAIDTSMQCNYGQSEGDEKVCSSECIENKCTYGHVWVETDVDYFTKSQDPNTDWANTLETKLVSSNETSALVMVTLDKTDNVSYAVTLVNDEGGPDSGWKIWRVDN